MSEKPSHKNHIFTGNIYVFHAFDVGDDVNLTAIAAMRNVKTMSLTPPKYFKHYHIPLGIELPHPHDSSKNISCKIHSFGAISLLYKIPFQDTLENIRQNILAYEHQFQEQSVIDARSIYNVIKEHVVKPHFFQTKSSYLVIQADPQPEILSIDTLKKEHGNSIASALRFETEALSNYQKNAILTSTVSYFRGELIIIDLDAAFVYDTEHEELLDFFEFANVQQLELQFFDWLLDQKLNKIYEKGDIRKLALTAYLPFIGAAIGDPVAELGKLKADILVITEQLESSIKLAGEPYFSELYALLVDRLDLKNIRSAIDRKLEIIKDIQLTLQHKNESIREDMLTVSIIILITIELFIAILDYIKA